MWTRQRLGGSWVEGNICATTYSIIRLFRQTNASQLGRLGWYWTFPVSLGATSVPGVLRIYASGFVSSLSPRCTRRATCAILTRSRTQGGIFTTPGDAYTTPVDMWVKALGEHIFFLRGTQTWFILTEKSNLSFVIGIESFNCFNVACLTLGVVHPVDLFFFFFTLKIFFWRKLAETMRSPESNQLAALLR